MARRHARTLRAVLLINVVMFAVESGAGLLVDSTALLADSLDMLGDAMLYGFTLFAASRGRRWQAAAALIKGMVMVVFGLVVIWHAVYQLLYPVMPQPSVTAAVGAAALLANVSCAYLLWRHRNDGINMESAWLCSRNDMLANAAVIVSASLAWATASAWPDLVVGTGIAILCIGSGLRVVLRVRDLLKVVPRTAA